jgi:hypothetical protein
MVTAFVIFALTPIHAQQRVCEETARFDAPEAHQGVAVDENYFYPVTNRAIGKYDKKTGKLVDRWEGPKDGPITHLDSGAVVDGKLYCAHANWHDWPMVSSVEIWDPKTMGHIGTHSFGIMLGSCTWIDRYDGHWWGVFANYSRVFGRDQRPYGNSYWTTLVKFNDNWQRLEAWIFPEEVIKRALPMSISGGSWGPDGLLYCTGHDNPELYSLKLPKAGSILELVEIVPINNHGQGIAWDRSDPGVIYAISRPDKQVVVSKLKKK